MKTSPLLPLSSKTRNRSAAFFPGAAEAAMVFRRGASRSTCVNVAVTSVLWSSVTVQVSVPEQPPPVQPVKFDPSSGTAVSTICVPWSTETEHVGPQSMPPAPPT